MNFRSFSDLHACISRNVWRLPDDVDLVVAVPRSGLLVATPIALHLNVPLTDVDGLVEGRLLSTGLRPTQRSDTTIQSARRIAVVDDSVSSGNEIRRIRARLQGQQFTERLLYVAAYATERSASTVDIFFELCPTPRVFAWNLMHHPLLVNSCVDIDGVLCLDPTEAENDDGSQYRHFLATARPLFRPTQEIGTIVTCRLEKYRVQTERWLAEHRIRYRELVMWNLQDKNERVMSGGHAKYKAEVFRRRPNAHVFIESSAYQAQCIAELASKPVICIETQACHLPGAKAALIGVVRNSPRWSRKVVDRLGALLRSYLID